MQIIWLQAYCLLYEKMSFSEAAAEMYISPSSFSKYIKSIEMQLGETLVDRSRYKISITEAGEKFYKYASAIVYTYEEMLSEFNKENNAKSNKLSIAVVTALGAYEMNSWFIDFPKLYPNINYNLYEMEMSQAMEEFRNKQHDFVVVRTNLIPDLSRYTEVRFCENEMFYICNPEYMEECPKEVSLHDIRKEKLILYKPAYDEMNLLMFQYGLDLNGVPSITTTSRRNMLREVLYNGEARSMMSEKMMRSIDPEKRLIMIPIKERPFMSLGMLSRPGEISPQCAEFRDYINSKLICRC